MKQVISVVLALILAACGADTQDAGAPAESREHAARMAMEHRADRPVASPAAQVDPQSPIRSQAVVYGNRNGRDLTGYLAYPANAEGGLPAILVIHEWWGLNDNIRAMADRLAAEGYAALAVDLYGGQTAADPEAALALMQKASADQAVLGRNLKQAHAFLSNEIKAARIGTLGWCFGGSMSLKAGVELGDRVDAVVVYYGHVSGDAEFLKPLQAPLLGLFGAADQGIPVESVRQFEAALKSAGKSAEVHLYDGAGHAFANPSGVNYKADAAEAAWKRTLEFLAAHLKGE